MQRYAIALALSGNFTTTAKTSLAGTIGDAVLPTVMVGKPRCTEVD